MVLLAGVVVLAVVVLVPAGCPENCWAMRVSAGAIAARGAVVCRSSGLVAVRLDSLVVGRSGTVSTTTSAAEAGKLKAIADTRPVAIKESCNGAAS